MSLMILQNMTRERPGFVLDILEEEGVDYKKVDLHKGEEISDFDGFSALVVLGGYDSANDETAKIKNKIRRIKEWIVKDKPYLGICLGLQVLVRAAGGSVVPNHIKEVGFRNHRGELYGLKLTEAGKSDPLFADIKEPLQFFQLHEDAVNLNGSMKLLAVEDHCANQAIKIGNCQYGIQCHFEINEEIFSQWLLEHPELSKMDQRELRDDFHALSDVHIEVGKRIFLNFLKIANLI